METSLAAIVDGKRRIISDKKLFLIDLSKLQPVEPS
jgi:hypothetical protein